MEYLLKFSRNLTKGKITETLFEQMLRYAGEYTILSFGYENVLPEVAHNRKSLDGNKEKETIKIIRRAPDFVVIDNESHNIYLVEVKYRMNPKKEEIFERAKEMYESWRPSCLFLATPNGFFFDRVKDILANKGEINKLNLPRVKEEIQEKYRHLLNEFIVPDTDLARADGED
jgi:hypothetical protein